MALYEDEVAEALALSAVGGGAHRSSVPLATSMALSDTSSVRWETGTVLAGSVSVEDSLLRKVTRHVSVLAEMRWAGRCLPSYSANAFDTLQKALYQVPVNTPLTIQVAASTGSQAYVYDTTAPTVAITTPISGGYLNNAEDESSLDISGTLQEPGSMTASQPLGRIRGRLSMSPPPVMWAAA
jgi:hypothetical protein